MLLNNCAGVLCHPTSFPSPYGIGDLGKSAYEFIDFLVKSNQKVWQVLPLSPTSFGDSPYQSFSTFAGNTLLISPEMLCDEGYIDRSVLLNPPEFDNDKVLYSEVINYKNTLYREAYYNFKNKNINNQIENYLKFCDENSNWIKDYSLFISIKNYFISKRKNEFETEELKQFRKKSNGIMPESLILDCYYGASFISWPEDILKREKSSISHYEGVLKEEIEYNKFLQFIYYHQWFLLKKYANNNDIKIIGDIPIFIAHDSADTWTNADLFYLDANLYPEKIAGVPPDYFSKTGQLWGNPVYNWINHEKSGYYWWIERVKNAISVFDIIRIDHFRGFESNWAISYGEKTAINGKWNKGPGLYLFEVIQDKLGELPIIAEDLGVLTKEVIELRDSLKYPGMKILQFAFDDNSKNLYLPHNFDTSNTIVYTGTHDNNTTVGWYNSTSEKAKDYLRRYLNVSGEEISWDLIRLAYSSCAMLAIIPLQDILSLDSTARMNEPSVAEGNWQWRYRKNMITDEISSKLNYLTELYGRDGLPYDDFEKE